jgi:hypothetical protein
VRGAARLQLDREGEALEVAQLPVHDPERAEEDVPDPVSAEVALGEYPVVETLARPRRAVHRHVRFGTAIAARGAIEHPLSIGLDRYGAQPGIGG